MTYQATGWAKHGRVARRGCGYTMAANETGLPAIAVRLAKPPVPVSSNAGR